MAKSLALPTRKTKAWSTAALIGEMPDPITLTSLELRLAIFG